MHKIHASCFLHFNWHIPCIDKAVHMLLIHKFGTIKTLIQGHYIFTTGDHLYLLYVVWSCYTNIRVYIVLTKRKTIVHKILFSNDISVILVFTTTVKTYPFKNSGFDPHKSNHILEFQLVTNKGPVQKGPISICKTYFFLSNIEEH